MQPAFSSLIATVQRNCDVSDARFAGDYTLCVYLLKMREFCRWSEGISFTDVMDSDAVGAWVDRRESYWASLQDQDYLPLTIGDGRYEPLDADRINADLIAQGCVYGGGIGRFSKPYFFLGELLRMESSRGYKVFVAGREYARELVAPPAMAQGNNIFVRRECLRRMLWEKIEDWRWQKRQNAMARAMQSYRFDRNPESALERMTENELEAVILHEIGEVVAGGLIGAVWDEMLITVARTSAETTARAVRDLLADCLTTLPALLDEENRPSLHFYFANLTPLRKDLFPALVKAYSNWVEGDDLRQLKSVVRDGKTHWLSVADRIVDAYGRLTHRCATPIERLVQESRY